MKNKNIAITGATGFLGKNLTLNLCNNGFNVRGLSRSKGKSFKQNSVSWFYGELDDKEIINSFLNDCDTVIHVAGLTKAKRPNDFYRVNRDLTKDFIEICKQKKIKRFIYISSLAAKEPSISHYSSSKKQAEDLLNHYKSSMEIMILRPPVIYGPGDKEVTVLFKMILMGIVFAPGDKNNRVSLIYVEDLCEAIRICVKSYQVNSLIEIDDGKDGGYSWAELTEIAADVLNKKAKIVYVPNFIVWFFGVLGSLYSYFFSPVMLTVSKVPEILHKEWISEGHSIDGWNNKNNINQGFKKTLNFH